MPIPPISVQKSARLGLLFRRKFHKGGTAVGIARARDLSNGKNVSMSTVKRMYSYFSRHAVDSQKIGFYRGEPGYPTKGAISFLLWGGLPGWRWCARILNRESP